MILRLPTILPLRFALSWSKFFHYNDGKRLIEPVEWILFDTFKCTNILHCVKRLYLDIDLIKHTVTKHINETVDQTVY